MDTGSEYIEVSVKVQPFSELNAEIVEAAMTDLPFEAFVVEEPFLKGYIPKDKYEARSLKVVLGGFPEMELSFSADLISPSNWNAGWEEDGFTPIVAGRFVTVKSWKDKTAPRSRFNISLNPDMAFGTGHHRTTFMMMESMGDNETAIRGKVVTDMGCGTGILSILAAKMGASRVHAIDIDARAARSAYNNVCMNRLAGKVDVCTGDASLLQAGHNDVILANIHRNIILMDLRTYVMALRPGGSVFLSGFYSSDIQAVLEEASRCGLKMLSCRSFDGWSCLVLSLI